MAIANALAVGTKKKKNFKKNLVCKILAFNIQCSEV